MPLILISGYPSCGKTRRSQQLVDYFQNKILISEEPRIKRLRIHHLNDQSLGVSREAYASARAEKDARATFSSAIKRVLTREDIVVADGMNYIKGLRYQLFCEAKAVQTPSCVVHIGTPQDTCRQFNEQALRDGTGGYESDLLENLLFRFEEPNGMTRWDSPLFTVPVDDIDPPYEAIWDALIGSDGKAKVVRPNSATVLKPAAAQDYLYELDKTTSEIVTTILAWQKDHPGESGGEIKIAETDLTINLPGVVPGLPQLQRLRRQFISLHRQHTLSKMRIRDLFVDYLNDTFQD